MRLFLLALLFAASAGQADAADWYTGAAPQKPDDDWIVAVSTSADVTSQGSYFGDATMTFAPGGSLSRSGARVRVDALGGVYSYRSNATGQTVRGSQESGSVLVGYEYVSPDLSVAGFLGGDVRNNTLSIPDTQNSVVGTTLGMKGSIEFYARPTPRTVVEGYGSYESNKNAYFTRLRGGYLITPNVYVGPEVAVLGDDFFNQRRFGAHVGGVHMGPVQIALSGGYLYDRVRKSGAYGTLDARFGF